MRHYYSGIPKSGGVFSIEYLVSLEKNSPISLKMGLIHSAASIREAKQDTGLRVSLFISVPHPFSALLGVPFAAFLISFFPENTPPVLWWKGREGRSNEVERRLRDSTFP